MSKWKAKNKESETHRERTENKRREEKKQMKTLWIFISSPNSMSKNPNVGMRSISFRDDKRASELNEI